MKCCVKWADSYSDWFEINAGVRQGDVLSPDFYSIYVDDLIKILEQSKKGCHHYGIFAAALFYADNMAVLEPSVKGLESWLRICGKYCTDRDICLNAKKSRCMYFGKKATMNHVITLNGNPVEWVDEWVYLGVSLKGGKCIVLLPSV